jgi:hypothetical protein
MHQLDICHARSHGKAGIENVMLGASSFRYSGLAVALIDVPACRSPDSQFFNRHTIF